MSYHALSLIPRVVTLNLVSILLKMLSHVATSYNASSHITTTYPPCSIEKHPY